VDLPAQIMKIPSKHCQAQQQTTNLRTITE